MGKVETPVDHRNHHTAARGTLTSGPAIILGRGEDVLRSRPLSGTGKREFAAERPGWLHAGHSLACPYNRDIFAAEADGRDVAESCDNCDAAGKWTGGNQSEN